jgi:molecular chaperone GrpE
MKNNDNNKNEDNFEDLTFVESTEDGEALPTKDIAKKLREEIKVLRKEKEEYLTGWQRAKADYINLQKEQIDSYSKNSIIAKEKFLENILPAIDSFDMAFSNKESWEKVDSNWRMGVEYIYSQIIKGLEDSGIEKIDKTGVIFDPLIHQSIETIKTDDESKDHTIEKIIQTGYKIGERIIRPAKVNIYEYKKE